MGLFYVSDPEREKKERKNLFQDERRYEKMNKKSVIEGRSKNVANFIKLDEVMTMAL